MTDHEKNVRTLIVSFVVAMMVMVPLRFVEATQQTLDATNRVLGEMTVAPVQRAQAVTVHAEAVGALEAPYNKIEGKTVCVSAEQAKKQVEAVINRYGGNLNKLNESQSMAVYGQIDKIDKSTCK